MLSSYLMRNPIYVNKTLQDYCKKTTEESIRKLNEKYNLERNKPKIKNTFDDNNKPEFNYFGFLLFLSITIFSFRFYKRLN
jgi:hypothetical protein